MDFYKGYLRLSQPATLQDPNFDQCIENFEKFYRDDRKNLFNVPVYLDTPVVQFEENINNTVDLMRHVFLGN